MGDHEKKDSAKHWSEVRQPPAKAQKTEEKGNKGNGSGRNDSDEEVDMDDFSRQIDKLVNADNPDDKLKEKLQQSLLMLVARGLVGTQRAIRELQATSDAVVWKAESIVGVVKLLRDRYQADLAEFRSQGPDHQLGGPQIMLTQELYTVILSDPGCLKEEQRKALEEETTTLEAMSAEDAMVHCRLMKIQKAFSKKGQAKMVKIEYSTRAPKIIMDSLATWFRSRDCKLMTGTPAATSSEHDILKVLRKLEEM